jgi:hypothetical protein
MSSQEIIKIEDDFTLIRFQNDGSEVFSAQREVSSGLIQFHFGLKGSAKFKRRKITTTLQSTKGVAFKFRIST